MRDALARGHLCTAVDTALLASERAGLRVALAIRSVQVAAALILFNLATHGPANAAFGHP